MTDLGLMAVRFTFDGDIIPEKILRKRKIIIDLLICRKIFVYLQNVQSVVLYGKVPAIQEKTIIYYI